MGVCEDPVDVYCGVCILEGAYQWGVRTCEVMHLGVCYRCRVNNSGREYL